MDVVFRFFIPPGRVLQPYEEVKAKMVIAFTTMWLGVCFFANLTPAWKDNNLEGLIMSTMLASILWLYKSGRLTEDELSASFLWTLVLLCAAFCYDLTITHNWPWMETMMGLWMSIIPWCVHSQSAII